MLNRGSHAHFSTKKTVVKKSNVMAVCLQVKENLVLRFEFAIVCSVLLRENITVHFRLVFLSYFSKTENLLPRSRQFDRCLLLFLCYN